MGKVVTAKKARTTLNKINVCERMDYTKARLLGLDCNVDIHQIVTDFVENWVKRECPYMFSVRAKL